MNTFKKILNKKSLILSFVFLFLASGGYALAQTSGWSNPPSNPPADNAPIPLNVSSNTQVKNGSLVVRGSLVTGLLPNASLRIGAGNERIVIERGRTDTYGKLGTLRFDTDYFRFYAGGEGGGDCIGSDCSGHQRSIITIFENGQTQIGAMENGGVVNIPTNAGLKVIKDIAARRYCDIDGGNCFDPSEGISGLWKENNGNVYRETGRVGIGISSNETPIGQLHVKNANASGNTGLLIESDNGNSASLNIKANPDFGWSINQSPQGRLAFWRGPSGGAFAGNKLIIHPRGLVEINDYLFSAGTIASANQLKVNNADPDGGEVVLHSKDHNTFYLDNYYGRFRIYNGVGGKEHFSINSDGGVAVGDAERPLASNLKMRVDGAVGASEYCDTEGENCTSIDQIGGGLWQAVEDSDNIYRGSGNVGIGTDNPEADLHIKTSEPGSESGIEALIENTVGPASLAVRSWGNDGSLELTTSPDGTAIISSGGLLSQPLSFSATSFSFNGNITLNNAKVADDNGNTDSADIRFVSKRGGNDTVHAIDSRSGALRFIQPGRTNMIVSPAGRIGIGTDNPIGQLHVKNANSSGNTGLLIESDNGGNANLNIKANPDFGWSINQNREGRLAFWRGPNGSAEAGNKMIVDPEGNVGIGIENPEAKLHVAGDIRADNICIIDGDECNDIGPGGVDSLWSSNGDNVYRETGRVGIGISSEETPIGQLHVKNANESGNTGLLIESDNGGSANLNLKSSAPFGWSINQDSETGRLAFWRGAVGGEGDGNRMVITPNGRVGIGTSEPDTKLDINGNIIANYITSLTGATFWEGVSFYNVLDVRGQEEDSIGIRMRENRILEFGATLNKQQDAGKIAYQRFGDRDALDIIGAGTQGGDRKIKLWDDVNVGDSLTVEGDTNIGGSLSVCNGTESCQDITEMINNNSGLWKRGVGNQIYYDYEGPSGGVAIGKETASTDLDVAGTAIFDVIYARRNGYIKNDLKIGGAATIAENRTLTFGEGYTKRNFPYVGAIRYRDTVDGRATLQIYGGSKNDSENFLTSIIGDLNVGDNLNVGGDTNITGDLNVEGDIIGNRLCSGEGACQDIENILNGVGNAGFPIIGDRARITESTAEGLVINNGQIEGSAIKNVLNLQVVGSDNVARNEITIFDNEVRLQRSRITNVGIPTADRDVATKGYVDIAIDQATNGANQPKQFLRGVFRFVGNNAGQSGSDWVATANDQGMGVGLISYVQSDPPFDINRDIVRISCPANYKPISGGRRCKETVRGLNGPDTFSPVNSISRNGDTWETSCGAAVSDFESVSVVCAYDGPGLPPSTP